MATELSNFYNVREMCTFVAPCQPAALISAKSLILPTRNGGTLILHKNLN